jgi:hypothetical protein
MPALRWAATAAVAGIFAGDVAVAAAAPPPGPSQAPVPAPAASPTPTPTPRPAPATSPTPTPTPTPTASPTPTPTPTPTPALPFPTPEPTASGTTIYVVTVTTTTTAINAPITWVAAPVTTNVSNRTSPAGSLEQSGSGKRAKLEVDLSGCGVHAPKSKNKSAQRAQLRLPKSGTLLLRVNGKRVGSLRLPSTSRGVPLRIMLSKDGMLTVRRPSGSVLHVQACTASKEAS